MYSCTTCQICNRKTRKLDGKKRFYMAKLPGNENLRLKWLKVIGKEELLKLPYDRLRHKFVCGDHFTPDDFFPLKTRLKHNVVPSVGLQLPPLSDDLLKRFTAEPVRELTHPENQNIPAKVNVRKTRLRKNTTKANGTVNPEPSTSYANISAPPRIFVSEEISQKANNVFHQENHLKDFYKNLNIPQSEELERIKNKIGNVKKTLLLKALGKRTIPKSRLSKVFSNKTKTETGIYSTLISHYKKFFKAYRTQSSEGKTTCVLLFDILTLDEYVTYNPCMDKVDGYVDFGDEGGRSEEIANHVLVFMLQNIIMEVKQPIAHYLFRGKLTPEVLSDLIKKVIQTVRNTGLTVIASVCNQTLIHEEAINLLRGPDLKSADINFYVIDNKKVYIVYDILHLFKSLRNNLIQYGELVMDTKALDLSHLNMVERKNSSTLHFTKITKEHVDTVIWSRKGIKLAVEIFSNTVAGILKGLSESKANVEKKDEIFEAGLVIGELDELYNCTSGLLPRGKKHPCIENVYSESSHHSLWAEYKRKFKNTHFVNKNSQIDLTDVRCIDGFFITLSSFENIWNYMEKTMKVPLNLTCLNLYSLADLLQDIKLKLQDGKLITSHYYELIINSMFLEAIKPCKKSNDSDLVNNEQRLISEEMDTDANENSVLNNLDEDLLISGSGLPESEEELGELFETFENHPNVYISAYLAVKVLKYMKCNKCREALEVNEIENDLYDNYTLLQDVWREKCLPIYPSNKLCMTVEKAINIFRVDIEPILYIKNICNYCVATMLLECDVSWMCEEHRVIMSRHLFQCLSCLLIRNHCRIKNQFIAHTIDALRRRRKRKQVRCSYY